MTAFSVQQSLCDTLSDIVTQHKSGHCHEAQKAGYGGQYSNIHLPVVPSADAAVGLTCSVSLL